MIMRHRDRMKFNPSGKNSYILPCVADFNFTSAFENDLDNGAPFRVMAVNGNKMYQFISALDFITLADKYNSPKMKQLAATLNEESNPVLVTVTLK